MLLLCRTLKVQGPVLRSESGMLCEVSGRSLQQESELKRRSVRTQRQTTQRYSSNSEDVTPLKRPADTNLPEDWKPKFLANIESDEPSSENVAHTSDDSASVQKAKEKFWGRMAVISLGAVLLSERLSGKGIVAALNLATGVPVWEIEPALGLVVGGLVAAAIYPIIRNFSASTDSLSPEKLKSLPSRAARTIGDSFQVTTGRLACLALAGTILAEATTGKGVLALLNIETGVEITEIEAGLTFLLLLLFTEDFKASK